MPPDTTREARRHLPMLAGVLGLVLVLAACSGPPGTASEPVTTEPIASEAPTVEPTEAPSVQVSSAPQASLPDNGTGRIATIHLDISNSRQDSDGSYSATGPVRYCGDALAGFGNGRAFNFEFPLSGTYEIGDVTFGALDLLPGSSTSMLHIGVNVKTAAGEEPPSTVVDTNNKGNSATAQLSESGGTTTLVVQGADDVGQTIHMTATCAPR
jgi:hypothetical protein